MATPHLAKVVMSRTRILISPSWFPFAHPVNPAIMTYMSQLTAKT
jgi:hypothetical protein